MWNQEPLAIIHLLAAELAREGRPERDAIRLFYSPLTSDRAEVERLLAASAACRVRDERTVFPAPVGEAPVMAV